MIDIYICEDSDEQREIIRRYVKAAILIKEYDMKLKIATDDPEKIIEELKLSKNTGLYFLDILLLSDTLILPYCGFFVNHACHYLCDWL